LELAKALKTHGRGHVLQSAGVEQARIWPLMVKVTSPP
jgi:hypothetical protein